MSVFKRLASNAVFGLQVLIVFLLFFEKSVEVPAMLKAVGRMHIVLLHFPIALFVLTAFLAFGKKWFASDSYRDLVSFLLHVTSLVASLSAVMGLLLAYEGGYDTDALAIHKWLGLTFSFFCWIILIVSDDQFAFKPLMALGVVLLVLTGHFGANLTHGENYLTGPLLTKKVPQRVLTDSSTVFEAAIQPVFESKCMGCHSEEKAKGKLILASFETAKRGGKNGVLWKSGDAAHSLVVKRLALPIDHKEHMPPKDKPQLSADEMALINMWIDRGADGKLVLKSLPAPDSLGIAGRQIANRYLMTAPVQSPYHFEFVSNEKIASLNSPTRSVFQMSNIDPALQAEFYLSTSFKMNDVAELSAVKGQLVSLNLSKMPVTDEDLDIVGGFKNLEILNLNSTQIAGDGLKKLSALNRLKSLSVSNTRVTATMLEAVASLPSLTEVFLWNTEISDEDVAGLRKKFPRVKFETGYHPDDKEVLQLSPPFLKNDGQVLANNEGVMFKHNLPGTTIRYALNDEPIDTVSGRVYKDPINFSSYAIVKVKAFKEGWRSSKENQLVFFKKGFKPERGELKSNPNNRYPGEGIQTLLDGKKGMPDFYRDPVWMAFREEPLDAIFHFEQQTSVKNITLSYARNTYAMCMPPAEMSVWAGDDENDLQLLKRVRPTQPTEHTSTRIEGVSVDLPEMKYRVYKIVATPLHKLPDFRKAPKDSGWLMVDEIFFN